MEEWGESKKGGLLMPVPVKYLYTFLMILLYAVSRCHSIVIFPGF